MPSVETVSALERRLNASIPQQAIRNQVAARLKHIGRTAKIPGFRVGKIPAKILEQHYGSEARQEALGEALQRSFAETVNEQALKVAGDPEFVVKTTDWNADGVVFQGGEAKDYPVTLGAGRMLPEFEAAIVGMSIGEEKSFDMTFPEDYHGKDVAGKQVTFTITLKSVEEPVLPEVDAEFAKSVGVEDGDASKLTDEIRTNLSREMTRRLKGRNKDAAMDVLLKVTQFELPKAPLQWEMHRLMEQTTQEMQQRGMVAQGMQLPVELFRERAEKRVRLGLILAYLVEKFELKAQPEKLREMVEDYAQSFEHPEEVVNWYYADPARLREIENLALEENVMDWVFARAKVTDRALAFAELMGN